MKNPSDTIRFEIRDANARSAYVALPGYPTTPTPGVVCQTQQLADLLPKLEGIDVNFDFDVNNRLIGIEILIWGTSDA